MDKYDWLYDAKLSELPEVYADIIETYGVEFLKALFEEYPGIQLHISTCKQDIMFANENELEKYTTEDIPEKYKHLAKKVGIAATIKFIRRYQGEIIYFSTDRNALGNIRNKNIRDEFNGYNTRELAIKYGVSERWIRAVLNKEDSPIKIRKTDRVPEGQISLFDT